MVHQDCKVWSALPDLLDRWEQRVHQVVRVHRELRVLLGQPVLLDHMEISVCRARLVLLEGLDQQDRKETLVR